MSGPYTVGLSGITNVPATYNLSDTVTAITGLCSGLAHLGFSYKTSAVGLPFDSVAYDTKLNNFSGIRPKFGGSINHGSFTVNETRLFEPKTPIEAWIIFSFSCRTSGTFCNEFDSLFPVSTGSTSISASCLGSYINADFACGDNIARPSGGYFTTEGVTGLKVVYSGIADNIYPLVKTSKTTGNLYKANSGQMIFVNYNGSPTPEDFRSWINEEFEFVKTTGVGNSIVYTYPGVDVYWSTTPTNEAAANVAWARISPCDSAASEPGASPGIYIISTNNNLWGQDPNAPAVEFIGQYGYNSITNRYINLNNGDGNYQIRFIVDRWHLGKIESNVFVTYYIMQYTTGGLPGVLTNSFTDYSDYQSVDYTWNSLKIPVTCKSAPVGEWISTGYAGTGVAVSIRDPMPISYNENNCGA
jgi:hypothetical protein